MGREWLKKTNPLFEKALSDETAETQAALTELRDRIAEWRKARAPENEFDFFLKKEAERIEKELQGIDAGTREEDALFLVVDILPAKIERVVNQPPATPCAVALAAWRERLADVETRSTASLVQELKRLKITPVDDPGRTTRNFYLHAARTTQPGPREKPSSNISSASRSIFRGQAIWCSRRRRQTAGSPGSQAD